MSRPKGLPKTGGRPKGKQNKKTAVLQEMIAVDPKLATLPPLDFLLSVYRTTTIPLPYRIDAAKGAAQYFHPKLVSVDPSQRPANPYANKTTQEINAIFVAELAKRGFKLVPIDAEIAEPQPAGVVQLQRPRGNGGGNGH